MPKTPALYLTNPVTLDFGGYIKYGDLKIYVNDTQINGNFVTNQTIEFKTSTGKTLFYLPQPIATDSNGDSIILQYEVKVQGQQVWFYVRTPYAWLSKPDRVYPVYVDPSIVSEIADDYSTSFPFQRKTFYANDRFWAIYSNTTSLVYASSTDGESWTNETEISDDITMGYDASVWSNGTNIYLAYTPNTDGGLYYGNGLPNSNGSITWNGIEQAVNSTSNEVHYTMISVDSDGYIWIAYQEEVGGNWYPFVTKSGNCDGTWGTTPEGFPYQLSSTASGDCAASIVPLSSGKMLAVYAYDGETVKAQSWNEQTG